jgi:glycosyl hydrolase family 5
MFFTNTMTNNHERGDLWNGEDLSIFSVDDSPLPASAVPQLPSLSRTSTGLSRTATASSRDVVQEEGINPANLKRTLANPSISSDPAPGTVELTGTPGYRAAEAYVRPSPISTVGEIKRYGFDLQKCEFALTVQAGAARTDTPTVVFLPEYHFPKDTCVVEVTSGKWEISSNDDEVVLLQRLKWWHAEGEQSLKVTGLVRKHNFVEGVTEEGGYYEQVNNWINNCTVM